MGGMMGPIRFCEIANLESKGVLLFEPVVSDCALTIGAVNTNEKNKAQLFIAIKLVFQPDQTREHLKVK